MQRPLTLRELMERFNANHHIYYVALLRKWEEWYKRAEHDAEFAAAMIPVYQHVLSDVERLIEWCKTFDKERYGLAFEIQRHWGAMVQAGPAQLQTNFTELGHIQSALLKHAARYTFLIVAPEQAPHIDNDRLFGDAVHEAFPDARTEIKSAGNCLGVELDAAAAFHLMRAAELILREFFAAKNITIPRRPNLEDADWSELVAHADAWLTGEIATISARNPARGSSERKLIDSYNALISDARYFKEERNKTMHPRHAWTHSEAITTLSRVGAFAERVARLI